MKRFRSDLFCSSSFLLRSFLPKSAGVLVSALALLSSTSSFAAVFYPETFTLANGLQVVVVQNKLSPAVSQMVWYKVGAVDEAKGKTGLAHYLEHLMFRGTAAVGPGAFSALISAEGGNDNAFTTHDYTGYYETVSADLLPMVMEMEADRMQNLQINPETATPELNVVLNERDERIDNAPQGMMQEKAMAALFPDHPYGRPVIGWKEDISKATAEDAKAFYRSHYAPNNAVLVISGNVDPREVARLAAGTFGRLPSQPLAVHRKVGMPPVPKQKQVTMRDARVEQPQMESMWVVPSYKTQKTREIHAYEVLQEVLDGGEIGYLHQNLVMDKQVASDIGVSYDSTARGPSVFSIAIAPKSGQDPAKLEEILHATLSELAAKGVSADKVEAAKRRMVRAAVFARDSLSASGNVLGEALVTGQPLSEVEDWPDHIQATSVADVDLALRTLLRNPRHISTLLLPDDESEAKGDKKPTGVLKRLGEILH